MEEIKELSVEEFQNFVVKQMEELGNTTTSNPTDEEIFPISVVSNVMQSIRRTEDNIPVFIKFSVTIEWWTERKSISMRKFQETNILLRKYNFAQIGTPIDLYDDITKKYRYGGRYEVNYNGLTNSFERII